MQSIKGFLPTVLKDEQREIIEEVIWASLQAVDPYKIVENAIMVSGRRLQIGSKEYELDEIDRVLVVSLGKAAGAMALAASDVLAQELTAGILVQKMDITEEIRALQGRFAIYQGSHPVPDENSLLAGAAVMRFLDNCTDKDLVIFLISGGGSALVVDLQEDLTLTDLQKLTRSLLDCGAQIDEINTIRKHLDSVKGGGLANAAAQAQKITLVLSDVVGNPLDMIASGPTVPDPTTFADAQRILEKYNLWNDLPEPILRVLKAGLVGDQGETPKPGDACFENSEVLLIGSNYQAASAGVGKAKELGIEGQILTTYLQGDAFQAGRFLGSLLRQIHQTGQPFTRPVCLIAGGETTVVVKGDGTGGRNLEVALGSVPELDGLEDVTLVSLATDGEDGPTDAAGAVVYGGTGNKALEKGFHADKFHNNSDSYRYFERLDSIIKIGATGTNVNDLVFLFAF